MQKNQKKFTLEDMLSLKKAEKPSLAEWENFNAQLKSKMLKAMVEETPKHSSWASPWFFAKIAAVAVPAVGVMLSFLANPASVENLSLPNAVEIVQIPQMETSYCSDSYFSTSTPNTEYAQDAIQSLGDSGVIYANNDLLALKSLSF